MQRWVIFDLRASPQIDGEAEERMVRNVDSWLLRRVVRAFRSMLKV